MTLCLLDRLNFVDNFTGIHIDRERCLRPFPPIETRENGFLGVQPMYIVYGGQVCFVCGNRLVYRKKKGGKSGHVQETYLLMSTRLEQLCWAIPTLY